MSKYSKYVGRPTRDGAYHHHPAADIDPRAEIRSGAVIDLARIGAAVIGRRTQVGDFTTILHAARIGDDCKVHRSVVIGLGVTVGSYAKVQNQVSIPPGVTIASCAFVGPGAKFPNDRHPRSFVPRREGPDTIVEFGASIGANATVVCGEQGSPTCVGEFSLLAAGSAATRSLRPFGLYVGNQQEGWVNVLGETVSRDANEMPAADVLLKGVGVLPEQAALAEQAIRDLIQRTQANLGS